MSTPEIDLDRHLAEEARGHAQEAAVQRIVEDLYNQTPAKLLHIFDNAYDGEYTSFLWRVGGWEYHRRVEESLQAEADSKSLDD